ncbi:MAG: SDR family oxidoreductase [Bdellovibrionales bacterium]|nr:SDR family oxidoreductase [Bdellovibrionales bacterium]
MKTAIVTGASSGIGAQISRHLSYEGYALNLLGRDILRLTEVKNSCQGDNHQTFNFDFTKTEEVQSFSQQWLKENSSPLKALVINAGNINRSSFNETPITEWEQQFQISVLGPISLIKEFWQRIINDKTTIITIASTLALKPIANTAAYSSLKAAMVNWSTSLAAEMAPFGVRVNCICPGIIETPIHGQTDSLWHQSINELVPLGRSGQPDDIAEMVSFLLSEKAKWITGTQQIIDGGLHNLR